jgi:hypothetical protein
LSDNWDFYFCQVDGKLASIFVDLGIRPDVPLKNYCEMAYLRLYMQRPRDDGLSSSDEFEVLGEIEDNISGALQHADHSVFIGRNTTDGFRDFVFYTVDGGKCLSVVQSVLRQFPQYRYETGSRLDAEWSAYLDFLYPSDRDRQTIENRRVIEALKSHGDAIAQVREISHWTYFPTETARAGFVLKARALGMSAAELSTSDKARNTYCARLVHADIPTAQSMNEMTLALFDAAQEHGGEYDGWESPVIRP